MNHHKQLGAAYSFQKVNFTTGERMPVQAEASDNDWGGNTLH
jgi:hypothetical protein